MIMNTAVISKTRNSKVVLLRDDYELLTAYFKNYEITQANDKNYFQKLAGELGRAEVLDKSEFPNDVVRLNSRVTIKDKHTGRIMELKLVLPDQADIKQRKISVLAPIG